jgi:1-acyl-sn-glycerol-3-phosphate acyltransferase
VSAIRAALKVARTTFTALDVIGRARLQRFGGAERAARLHWACAEIAAIHGLRLAVTGRWPRGPAVIVSNHVSYLDAIAIAACVPCAPIAKGEVEAWPILGPASGALGAMFVARDSGMDRARVLRRALRALRGGVRVLNFPEGTTTDGSELLPFHRGIFGIARIAGVPVVPVAVRCARELAWHGNAPFVPHYLRTTARTSLDVELDVGAPIASERFASADELAAHAHHRIAHALRGQVESHHDPVIRVRVSASRSDAVLPVADRRVAR